MEVCKPAYADEILEDPAVFDELAQHQYNALVREGNSVIPSAPMMNSVIPSAPVLNVPIEKVLTPGI